MGDWQRSEVKAGIFTYTFKSTATHNPSFWEFYLTKPEADLSKQLAWDDLTLIAERGKNGDRIMPVNETYPNGERHGEYVMDITIPEERRGNAILFVRWQPIAQVVFLGSSFVLNVAVDLAPLKVRPFLFFCAQ